MDCIGRDDIGVWAGMSSMTVSKGIGREGRGGAEQTWPSSLQPILSIVTPLQLSMGV